MTTNAYHFDARDEVGKLLADYPDLAKRLIVAVIKIKAENDNSFIVQKFLSSKLAVSQDDKSGVEKHVTDCTIYTKNQGSSIAHSAKHGVNVIVLREPDTFHDKIPADQFEQSKAFVLYHEAGHVLIEGGFCPDVLYREHLADAFATIRMLQKFDDVQGVINNISWSRAFNSVDSTIASHMTTCMIDRILADSERYDFKKLTPDKTIAVAEDYAFVSMPKPAEVDQTIRLYREQPVRCLPPSAPKKLTAEQRLKCVYAFANAALGADNNYPFYIGARICAPVLSKETANILGMPEDIQSRMRSQFTDKAQRCGLPVLAACIATNPVAKKSASPIL